jgi:hypothetical protein
MLSLKQHRGIFMKLSQLRPILHELFNRGYERHIGDTYKKTLRHGDLRVDMFVSLSYLFYVNDIEDFLDLSYAEHMDKLAAAETKQRLG